jgi:hypothetical protein
MAFGLPFFPYRGRVSKRAKRLGLRSRKNELTSCSRGAYQDERGKEALHGNVRDERRDALPRQPYPRDAVPHAKAKLNILS